MSKKASTKARGYTGKHRKLRDEWKRKVEAGLVDCARCGKWIVPGSPWDLGHADFDRSVWIGPEHRWCNRSAAARKLNAIRRRRPRFKGSRVW